MTRKFKQLITALCITSLLIVPTAPVWAQEAPPEAPTAPSAPSAPPPPPAADPPPPMPTMPTAPEQPTPPPEPTLTAEAPTAPTETITNPSTDNADNTNDSNQISQPEPAPTGSTGGQVGDTTITTGDANSSVVLVSDTNTNSISDSPLPVSDPGSLTNNSVTNNADNSVTTTQNNSVNEANNVTQNATSGTNDSSNNVGNTTINSGDANVSGTMIVSTNTNVDTVALAEFNVYDNHVGDLVLDFNTGCISGCDLINSSASGTNSLANFQNNTANLDNSMSLAADSGSNSANNNTGGDNTIATGDANVSANAITFANNNLSGDVIYSVVNLYGSLVGDIIFPEEYLGPGTTIAATNNGSDTTNSVATNTENVATTDQTNTAVITDNLALETNTGGNQTTQNTDGNNQVVTGDSSIVAQVLNVVNSNVIGDVWVVLVNEAGQWLGKIMGADPGANYASSPGMEFTVDASGQINVTNGLTVNQTNTQTTSQTNTASVNNNLRLSANTGNNSASRNTGGDNSITTGDATIIANLVNFINNNIAGSGRLFITVVNVFGSWIGNFRGPGVPPDPTEIAQVNPTLDQTNNSDPGRGGESNLVEDTSKNVGNQLPGLTPTPKKILPLTGKLTANQIFSESTDTQEISPEGEGSILGVQAYSGAATGNAHQAVKVNLAWLIFLAPPISVLFILRRRFRRQF